MNIKDVENLAELARIELSGEEKEGLLLDMEGILKYVETVNEVKTGELESNFKLYNISREDQKDSREFAPELIKSQFPESQDGFLKVKKIL